ncbi:MAG: hypothetical protein GY854_09520 [Deltaproteobacteria bacterium]|nr:hypothetical protein [Deltaproteobacteria bacterium]
MSHTHINQGDYGKKHPQNTQLNERIAEAIKARADDTRLACSAGAHIAEDLGVTMEEVGRAADLIEVKVSKCQLGLFGYGKTKNKSRIMEPADTVAPELEEAIRGALDGGKLPCASAWEIASKHGISKLAVCAAADALKIKSTHCQLGAF